MKQKCGIYKILNSRTGKFYIGSSNNLPKRWVRHKYELKKQIHSNGYLQNSYNKHGLNSFIFIVLEFIPDKTFLVQREQYWLDKLTPYKRSIGYNILERARGGPNTKSCTVPDCNNKHLAKGLCNKHYRRFKRYGDITYCKTLPPIKNRGCKVPGCDNKHDSLGYCGKHSHYIRKYGKIQQPKIVIIRNRGCKIHGCKNKHQSKGLCHKHYARASYNKSRNKNNFWSKLLD